MSLFKWFSSYPNKIGFEDVKQTLFQNNTQSIIINTLPSDDQSCLIKNTLLSYKEEKIIN